jgi:DNA-binding transcriptional LysR family regulator
VLHAGDPKLGDPYPVRLSRPRGRTSVREPELSELRAFCAAAHLGSIAEAARSLHVSQPALSKRLRTLEAVVGAELLVRSSRGVTLTEAGQHLYNAALRVLDSADTIQALIRNPASSPPVRLASSATIAEARLPQVLADLAAFEPGLAIELITANSWMVRELVGDGKADLGIAAVEPFGPPNDGLQERIVWRDEIVIGVPRGHPWQHLDEIPAVEFAATPTVQRDPWSSASRAVATVLERRGLRWAQPAAAIGSTDAMIATAIATGTPALLSLLSLRDSSGSDLTVRRVEGMNFDREFALIWPGSIYELEPAVQAVAHHVLDLPFARSRRRTREFQRS